MAVKTDYMDILLEKAHSKLEEYSKNLKEMIEAEKQGMEAYPKVYIRQIAPAVHHYYVLVDDTYQDARKQIGLKRRHREMYARICQVDRELEQMAKDCGFGMGMLGAMMA